MELFHYTDEEGYLGIKRVGRIQASRGNRAKFGEGVYLTDLKPNEDKKLIAKILFSSGGTTMHGRGRLDHYIRIKVPSDQPKQIRDHVFLMRRDELPLSEFEWDGGHNDSWGLTALGLVVGLGALALAGFLASKRETTKDKLDRVLTEFKSTVPHQDASALQVFSPDAQGEVCIWCTRCFVRACYGFPQDAAPENINQKLITSCLHEHIHESMHQIQTPSTRMHEQFRNKVREKYGEDGMHAYFKLEACIRRYQNLNREVRWIHRLKVDVHKSDSDRMGVCVLCTRCDLAASSMFWLDEGEGSIEEQEVHQQVENHFHDDIFQMHGS